MVQHRPRRAQIIELAHESKVPARSFSFLLQTVSRTSLSGSRIVVTFTVTGLVYSLESSTVICTSLWPKLHGFSLWVAKDKPEQYLQLIPLEPREIV